MQKLENLTQILETRVNEPGKDVLSFLQEQEIRSLGNTKIINHHKTAFLCSRRYPAKAVLRIYDWAKAMRERGECVISGFHSRLERDVLDILLKGPQPIILAAARGLQKRYSPNVRDALDSGRLLVLSPFPDSVTHITADTARIRNEFMLTLADRIVIGYMSKDGLLAKPYPPPLHIKRLFN